MGGKASPRSVKEPLRMLDQAGRDLRVLSDSSLLKYSVFNLISLCYKRLKKGCFGQPPKKWTMQANTTHWFAEIKINHVQSVQREFDYYGM